MTILLTRGDGSASRLKNQEYLPAFFLIPEELLCKCGKEIYSIPRNIRRLRSDRNALETIESDVFIQVVKDGAIKIVAFQEKPLGNNEGQVVVQGALLLVLHRVAQLRGGLQNLLPQLLADIGLIVEGFIDGDLGNVQIIRDGLHGNLISGHRMLLRNQTGNPPPDSELPAASKTQKRGPGGTLR